MKKIIFRWKEDYEEDFIIKAKFENNILFFKKLDERGYTNNLDEITNNYFFLYQEDKELCEKLQGHIKLNLDKIINSLKNSKNDNKVMFMYQPI